MGYRDYSVAKGHIVDATGHGDFTTISAALSASVSGDTIFIRPGVYTEDPPLIDGVNLVSYQPYPSNVLVIGKFTYSGTGLVSIYGFAIQTNNDYLIEHTGTGTLTVNECYLSMSNNTGISFTGASGGVVLNSCKYGIGVSTAALYNCTGGGGISLQYCIGLSAVSTTASNNSAGVCVMQHSVCASPFSTSGTGGLIVAWSEVQTNQIAPNQVALALNGTGPNFFDYSNAVSGTVSAITIGAGAVLPAWNCSVNSTNANAIAGTGVLNAANIVFTGTSSTIQGTLTVNAFPVRPP